MRLVDLTGMTVNRLFVIKREGSDANGHPYWLCACSCGKQCHVLGGDLVRSNDRRRAQSCGCFRKENTSLRLRVHGLSKTREYGIWKNMLSRCRNRDDKSYANYGGRGIRVSKRWDLFTTFLEDMGRCPAGFQIDRIDNDGGYERTNCRWVSRKDNCRNKRNSHMVLFSGLSLNCCEWSARSGFPAWTVANRINRGWSAKRAITTPVRHFKKTKRTFKHVS